jgi:uncharacterized protein
LRQKSRVVLEVSVLFLVVIGICRLLFSLRSIPMIAQTLPLWAAGLFLYVPLLLLFHRRLKPETWGLSLRGAGFSVKLALVISLVCLPSFLIFFYGYQKIWLHVRPVSLKLTSEWGLLLLYHLVCVAFPEEVFYRGYMQSRLNEVFPGGLRVFSASLGFGWIYTAVVFAAGHFLVDFRPDTLATFFPGLVFGWLRERTGSVVASTIFHALCNATILLLA